MKKAPFTNLTLAAVKASEAEREMVERQYADQMNANCRWLIGQIDRIHDALCPEKNGTWQQRAQQAVEAAEEVAKH